MVFGIDSARNTVRKCRIARGEAECYLLPDCIASAINPKYHSRPSYCKLILHPTFTVGFCSVAVAVFVAVGAKVPLDFAVSHTADSASEMQVRVGGAGQARRRLDGRGYGCWVLVWYGMESGTPTTTSLPSLVFEQLVCAVFAQDSYVGRAERVRRFLCFSHTPFIFATTEGTKPQIASTLFCQGPSAK